MKIVIATGGFDPIHSGHISYLKSARDLGDYLIVGVNSDEWLKRKKGRYFMPWEERASIVSALSCVDLVLSFDDEDDSAINCLEQVKALYPDDTLIFVNGGDRTKDNIPEMAVKGVDFKFGIGGEDKRNSSSWILKEWSQPTIERAWGTYTVLNQNGKWAVKELSFKVGKALSDQRHFHRSEHWHVVDGTIRMNLEFPNGDKISKIYNEGDSIDIPMCTWHKAINIGNVDAKVVEVWMGEELKEEDIERRD